MKGPYHLNLEHLSQALSLPSFVRTHFVLDPEKIQKNDELNAELFEMDWVKIFLKKS